MKNIIVLLLMVFVCFPSYAQSSGLFDLKTGEFKVSYSAEPSKKTLTDREKNIWKGVNTLTKSIPSRKDWVIEWEKEGGVKEKIEVEYSSGTYTLFVAGVEKESTTTIAAIRGYISSYIFFEVTGKKHS